ncbi:MAG TPA: PfkB family carbohydrate kinase [Myxococcaceae bacterium]|nr:PfkB family carbohydrate kinase [Myxococcaceae bacterium]
MASELSRLLPALRARKLVVVGDLVADHYVYGQTDRVSREAPVLIVRHESSEVTLGGAANAAANARALGAEVTVVGVLGRDEMGEAVRQRFAERGIGVVAVDAPFTETKTRILAGGLNTSRQQMLRLDRGNTVPLPPAVSARLRQALEEAAQGADAVLVSDYGGGVVGDATRATLRHLAGKGTLVSADSRYSLGKLTGFRAAKPNEPELAALTGLPVEDDRGLSRAAEEGLRLLDAQVLLVTRGRRGMALLERGGAVQLLPAHGTRAAVDVTGAGDTVMAAFTLGLAAGASPRLAAELANVAGALVVLKPGTAPVTAEELAAELGGR